MGIQPGEGFSPPILANDALRGSFVYTPEIVHLTLGETRPVCIMTVEKRKGCAASGTRGSVGRKDVAKQIAAILCGLMQYYGNTR